MSETNPTSEPVATDSGGLQVLREGMAAIVSIVIVALAAFTMWFTFTAAGYSGADPSREQAIEKAYNRQKDIMLYAFALFGTVTGYYLGRVPAEANAKRAEKAAATAQTQLSRTQEKLSDVASTSSSASARLDVLREQKVAMGDKLQKSTKMLRVARDAISQAAASGGTSDASRPSLGPRMAGGATSGVDPEQLRALAQEIDDMLDRLQDSGNA